MLTWLLSLAYVTESFYAKGNLVSLEMYLGLSSAWRQKSSSASSSLPGQPTFLVVVSCYDVTVIQRRVPVIHPNQ